MIVIIMMSDCQSEYMPMAGGCFAVFCSDNIYINELLSINIYANYWHLFFNIYLLIYSSVRSRFDIHVSCVSISYVII